MFYSFFTYAIYTALVFLQFLELLVANVFHQGPSLVIALGRFFRAPLSEDESMSLFFSECM